MGMQYRIRAHTIGLLEAISIGLALYSAARLQQSTKGLPIFNTSTTRPWQRDIIKVELFDDVQRDMVTKEAVLCRGFTPCRRRFAE